MADDDSSDTETQLAPDLYVSPLHELAVEVHEIYEELQAVGFPRDMLAEVVAHIITDTVLYRGMDGEDEDDEDEDEDEDDGPDGALDLHDPDD